MSIGEASIGELAIGEDIILVGVIGSITGTGDFASGFAVVAIVGFFPGILPDPDVQYSAGTVDLVNGSTVITGVGTAFVANNVQQGHLFVALMPGTPEASVAYQIASVGGEEQLTLDAPWSGPSIEGAAFVVHRDVREFGLPRFRRGDEALQPLLTHALVRIDAELRGLGA